MSLDEYYAKHGSRISQESERLFINDFLYPLLRNRIDAIEPQRPFIDSSGKARRIDFAHVRQGVKLALEVNGETYHAEGIIPDTQFDDNLFRQNEILAAGFSLLRFSYNQLQNPRSRPQVMESLRRFLWTHAPDLLGESSVRPTEPQREALQALHFYRSKKGWRKGVVILPTGTGKTFLSAFDAKRHGGRVLFLVHRLDILKQSMDAYARIWPLARLGILTGEAREHVTDCDVLFASKDTIRQPSELKRFGPTTFDYIVVDEVHHGQSPSYRVVLDYFRPRFILGMTATPDRTDRKDILELFDYNKIFDMTVQEAIARGFLVPFTYYGLTDNVDYSQIRHNGQRYRVDDLEKHLIIPARNNQIVNEYIDIGQGDKAIGFCASIRHAERMAEVFCKVGIPAFAITSETANRDELIADFRENKFAVAFTVDLFNEGIDFPNLRVLLFLRPTESKTVFLQQLGRGLRLCSGKDRVRVLDFIGNYKRANQIRKYLSKTSKVEVSDDNGKRRKKVIYEYAPGCAVRFTEEVEEILNRQDEADLEVTKDDLRSAYYALAEELGRKPSQGDLNDKGQFKAGVYVRLFGSWLNFLHEMGEYTEASYHYPQGVHLGHLLAILSTLANNKRTGSRLDDRYIRMRGGLDEGRLGSFQRQTKYKLQAAMELGIIFDDRVLGPAEPYVLDLTPKGKQLYEALEPLWEMIDLSFKASADEVPRWEMTQDAEYFNSQIKKFLASRSKKREVFFETFISMHAVGQMLCFLYQISRKAQIEKKESYEEFFGAPFVKAYCDQEGIPDATAEGAKHRCPFLLNILEACGVVHQTYDRVEVLTFVAAAPVVRAHRREALEEADKRAQMVHEVWPSKGTADFSDDQMSILRELFGEKFLTDKYFVQTCAYVKVS
jgi:superfamily II DNA or RNA helicase